MLTSNLSCRCQLFKRLQNNIQKLIVDNYYLQQHNVFIAYLQLLLQILKTFVSRCPHPCRRRVHGQRLSVLSLWGKPIEPFCSLYANKCKERAYTTASLYTQITHTCTVVKHIARSQCWSQWGEVCHLHPYNWTKFK